MQLQIRLNLKNKYLVDSPTGVSTGISYKHPNFTSPASLPPTLIFPSKFSITINHDTRNPEATHSSSVTSPPPTPGALGVGSWVEEKVEAGLDRERS